MKRGRDIHQAYAERLEQERLSQHNVGRCAWCPDIQFEGTLEETRALLLAHRLEHHPDAQPRKRTRRVVPMRTQLSNKSIDDNIANARVQGAATWEGAA